ncbi:MAG: hypothetical protein PWR22_489 [Moorella sp. (in: firmicutes)]|jgi:hypothetical protein|uniref:hypothetical protein n=1 Tax=Moorella sp. E306M TaxID=2572683 RepID=UPI0010FFBD02|nr:hypothetical protein [Moorella sp. E306M]MDK2815860.1 hypothetical protein [Moorella sp. (in: firmicutes)]MDK2893907.1 hypothetical protein [Moorella sp. (in: firmicutes)]GEA18765.1 hypothetical protein E306M_19020 [Moorella sp. E306M]
MTAKTIDILLHILVVALVLVLLYRGVLSWTCPVAAAGTTVADLLKMFEPAGGSAFADDRVLLTGS